MRTSTDPDEIRRWAEARGGRPVIVREPWRGPSLRIGFCSPPAADGPPEPISWEEFFAGLEIEELAVAYEDADTAAGPSRRCQLVPRAGHRAALR